MSTVCPRAAADGVRPPGAVAVSTALVPPRRSSPSLGVCRVPAISARYRTTTTARTTASARPGRGCGDRALFGLGDSVVRCGVDAADMTMPFVSNHEVSVGCLGPRRPTGTTGGQQEQGSSARKRTGPDEGELGSWLRQRRSASKARGAGRGQAMRAGPASGRPLSLSRRLRRSRRDGIEPVRGCGGAAAGQAGEGVIRARGTESSRRRRGRAGASRRRRRAGCARRRRANGETGTHEEDAGEDPRERPSHARAGLPGHWVSCLGAQVSVLVLEQDRRSEAPPGSRRLNAGNNAERQPRKRRAL